MDFLFALLTAYLIGSIPFGLLLAKAAGKGDIRQIGSGNIGATNVLRTGAKGLAAATLLLDLLKGLAAIVLVEELFYPFDGHLHLHPLWGALDPVPVAALGVVIGHCFPIWLRFRGGKGVATNAGVCLGLGWQIGLAYALVWLGVLAITRTSSLAGMSAVIGAVIASVIFGYFAFVPVLVLIALLVLFLHRENIARLRSGTEPRIGGK